MLTLHRTQCSKKFATDWDFTGFYQCCRIRHSQPQIFSQALLLMLSIHMLPILLGYILDRMPESALQPMRPT